MQARMCVKQFIFKMFRFLPLSLVVLTTFVQCCNAIVNMERCMQFLQMQQNPDFLILQGKRELLWEMEELENSRVILLCSTGKTETTFGSSLHREVPIEILLYVHVN